MNNYIMYPPNQNCSVFFPYQIVNMGYTPIYMQNRDYLNVYISNILMSDQDFCEKTNSSTSSLFSQKIAQCKANYHNRHLAASLLRECSTDLLKRVQAKMMEPGAPFHSYCSSLIANIQTIRANLDGMLGQKVNAFVSSAHIPIASTQLQVVSPSQLQVLPSVQLQVVPNTQLQVAPNAQLQGTQSKHLEDAPAQIKSNQTPIQVRVKTKQVSGSDPAQPKTTRTEAVQKPAKLKRPAEENAEIPKQRKVYLISPQNNQHEEILRERNRRSHTLSYITQKDVSRDYPDLYPYCYVNKQRFSAENSYSIPACNTKELLYGQCQTVTVSTAQVQAILSDIEGHYRIGGTDC